MDKLFEEREIFNKERPEFLTDEQLTQIYKEMADEIIAEDWSNSDPAEIIIDLKDANWHDSGFEIAKGMDNSYNADYNFTGDFINWLDDIDHFRRDKIEENVRTWVKAHNIQPKYKIGDRVFVKKDLMMSKYPKGEYYITGYHKDIAKYTINKENKPNCGLLVEYEELEGICGSLVIR